MSAYCVDHMPAGWPENGHMLSGSRDCVEKHLECDCANWPNYITQGCPQHAPRHESTD